MYLHAVLVQHLHELTPVPQRDISAAQNSPLHLCAKYIAQLPLYNAARPSQYSTNTASISLLPGNGYVHAIHGAAFEKWHCMRVHTEPESNEQK